MQSPVTYFYILDMKNTLGHKKKWTAYLKWDRQETYVSAPDTNFSKSKRQAVPMSIHMRGASGWPMTSEDDLPLHTRTALDRLGPG